MTGETFVLGLLALLTIIVSVLLWNVFATARAKITANRTESARHAAAGGDADYRRLAERAIDAHERIAESLAELTRQRDPKPGKAPTTAPRRA